jgi:hypothetical protein
MSEELPAAVVTLLGPIGYLSTACQTAQAITNCTSLRLPQTLRDENLPMKESLAAYHHRRCRLTHKFTGTPCQCPCHQETTP